ncbi:MAG TPA: hypothetical protein VF125_07755 [Solirubrobacterales bacterium]
MGKALGLAVALVLLFAPPATAFNEPSGELVAGSEETVLRLHDLPPGYQVSDDSGCGALGPAIEGELSEGRFAERYSKWVLEYRPEGCELEYEQIFEVPGLKPAPPLVKAGTVNTPSEAAADSGFGLFMTLVNHYNGGRYRKTVSISPSGFEALLFRSNNELVAGLIHKRATILFWHHGNLLATVEAAGENPRSNDLAALHFAQIQQERLERPSPYTEAERDDTEVWLDNPALKFPVYWVGNPFQAGGGPAVALEEAFAGTDGPPGQKFELDYELLEPNGFTIGGWTRRGWKRFQRSGVGKANRTARCTRTTEVKLERGRAVIYGAYDERRRVPCPRRSPDGYYAIAHIGRMVIGINLGNCLSCLPGSGVGFYSSLHGMKALVRALHVRPPVF